MNIKQKFITTLLLIGLLPMLVVGTIAYNTINNAQVRSTVSQLNSTSIKQEQKITTLLHGKQEEVVKLANQFDLQVQLRQFLASSTEVNRSSLAAILQAKKTAEPTMQAVYLLNTSGEMITSSAIGTPLPLPHNLTLSAVGTAVSIHKDAQDGFNKLYITTPVTVNKQPAATIVAAFRVDDLVAVAQDYTGLGETGETVIAAKENVSLFPLRFDTDATLKTNVGSMKLHETAAGIYREAIDYRGKQVFVVAHPVGSTGWAVATKIDRSEAFAPVFALRDSLLAAVLFVSLILTSVALLSTRLFTRPILQIGRVSRQIGRGDFSAKLDIRRKDEIGALARNVNTMGENLKQLVGGIESQRQRLQVVLDSTVEGIFAVDAGANIVLANNAAAQLLHATPEELVGKNLGQLFEWKHGKQVVDADYVSPGVRHYPDLQFTDSAGNVRYAKMSVAGVASSGKEYTTKAIVTVNDETASHDLENMKTDFVSLAAHELRTPLTAVRGYLEVALYKESQGDSADTVTFVRQALKNVAELGGLINNLLDVSRIERGTLTLTIEKVDLAACLSRLLDDAKFAADDKKITITFDSNESPAFVMGDELALREVFNNLVMNAIKYNHEAGTVKVRLRRQGEMYHIDIEDTGRGIPASAIPHLFSKFYRVHGGLASGSGGTGLGLFIAKSIVGRHHGTISVKSQEGKGSTFTVLLPVFNEEAFKKQRPEGEPEATVRRKRGWVTKNIAR